MVGTEKVGNGRPRSASTAAPSTVRRRSPAIEHLRPSSSRPAENTTSRHAPAREGDDEDCFRATAAVTTMTKIRQAWPKPSRKDQKPCNSCWSGRATYRDGNGLPSAKKLSFRAGSPRPVRGSPARSRLDPRYSDQLRNKKKLARSRPCAFREGGNVRSTFNNNNNKDGGIVSKNGIEIEVCQGQVKREHAQWEENAMGTLLRRQLLAHAGEEGLRRFVETLRVMHPGGGGGGGAECVDAGLVSGRDVLQALRDVDAINCLTSHDLGEIGSIFQSRRDGRVSLRRLLRIVLHEEQLPGNGDWVAVDQEHQQQFPMKYDAPSANEARRESCLASTSPEGGGWNGRTIPTDDKDMFICVDETAVASKHPLVTTPSAASSPIHRQTNNIAIAGHAIDGAKTTSGASSTSDLRGEVRGKGGKVGGEQSSGSSFHHDSRPAGDVSRGGSGEVAYPGRREDPGGV